MFYANLTKPLPNYHQILPLIWAGRVVRWYWVNFQCRGVLLAVGASGGCLDIFTLVYLFTSLSPSLKKTARYRLKYCLKGPLNPNKPTKPLI